MPSSKACFAVGRLASDERLSGFVREWNGTEWVLSSSFGEPPTPLEATRNELSSISCSSAKDCIAVGSYSTSSGILTPLAEHLISNIVWESHPVPLPKGAKGGSLTGVSCSSPEACTAVGNYYNSSGTSVTLAERWNGKEWAVQETPNPKQGKRGSQLSAVSCTSSETCIAVGSYSFLLGEYEFSATVTERWNGKEWTIEETPNPKEARFSNLAGISCTTSTTCTAVGSTQTKSEVQASFAERWNGKAWVLEELAKPKEAKTTLLVGISCTSSEACIAVGSYYNSSGTIATLAEHWNGKEWTIEETANLKEAKEASLDAISCTSPETCTAIGAYSQNNRQTTLAERYF
jgi:hypothetical protein